MIQRVLISLSLWLLPIVVHGAPLGCLVTPERVAEIGTPVAGVLASVAVERGDRVRKGQTLAVISSSVERAGVDAADTRARSAADIGASRANLQLARQRYERTVDLHRRAFVSQQALDQAEAEFRVAEQKLAQSIDQQQLNRRELQIAQAQLGQRQLRAPFDGVVIDRMAQPGERVEDRPLMRIASIDTLRAEVAVSASQFGVIAEGDSAWLTPGLPGAQPVSALVELVDPIIDPASNTFRVRLRLDNAGHAVPAGVRCKVEFAGLEPAQADREAMPAPSSLRTSAMQPETARRAVDSQARQRSMAGPALRSLSLDYSLSVGARGK